LSRNLEKSDNRGKTPQKWGKGKKFGTKKIAELNSERKNSEHATLALHSRNHKDNDNFPDNTSQHEK